MSFFLIKNLYLGLNDASRQDSSSPRAHKRTQATPSAPLQQTENNENKSSGRLSPEEETGVESQNIPLMRIVMSKKQTKRQNNRVLREGWMVHYTDKQNMVSFLLQSQITSDETVLLFFQLWFVTKLVMKTWFWFQRKKHYWRLDTKCITMYKDEESTGYYKVSQTSHPKL